MSAQEFRPGEIAIVFDGGPGLISGRFVEVENAAGASISIGRWVQVGDLWHLRIVAPVPEPGQVAVLLDEDDIKALRDASHEMLGRSRYARQRIAAILERVREASR